MKFVACRYVYPLVIFRPINKMHVIDFNTIVEQIIADVHANQLKITHFIGDNPKRALARNCQSHASTYPCEYCVHPGASFRQPGSLPPSQRRLHYEKEKKNSKKKFPHLKI